MAISCHEKKVNINKDITIEAFSEMRMPEFVVDTTTIFRLLDYNARHDNGQLVADKYTRKFYKENNRLLWLSHYGLNNHADSIVAYLENAYKSGIDTCIYNIALIKNDIKRIKDLNFDQDNEINKVIARLEYNLTKAYFRYTSIQRYGFVNPESILNNLCVKDSDSIKVRYHRLFDKKIDYPGKKFFKSAVSKVMSDSVVEFLHEVQPASPLYGKLLKMLSNTFSTKTREKIICNIERCRWCLDDYPHLHNKYIVVNIPSFNMFAVDGDSITTMKIGCGEVKTKTPLLTSKIMRMDLNPQWIVPKSIAKDIIYSTGYLQREHMFIYDKKRGKVGYDEASLQKVMDNQQFIIQEGGKGNSLGRIIFRFPNNFSVYLHDTSSPWIFQRDYRAVSHGCVRVERPFDFAVFLLDKKDSETIEKIKYSMNADIGKTDTPEDKKERIDRSMMVNNVKVEPEVPLFITYYTYFTDKYGNLNEYKDVYGYDEPILKELRPYIK